MISDFWIDPHRRRQLGVSPALLPLSSPILTLFDFLLVSSKQAQFSAAYLPQFVKIYVLLPSDEHLQFYSDPLTWWMALITQHSTFQRFVHDHAGLAHQLWFGVLDRIAEDCEKGLLVRFLYSFATRTLSRLLH